MAQFKFRPVAITLAALLVVGTVVIAEEAAEKIDFEKIKCVVSGKPVNPEATADYKKATVYFCCPGCPGAFAKKPEKFESKVHHQMVATKQAKQKSCPMSGKDCDPDTAIQVAGVSVAFCCGNCKKAAEGKEGDAQIDLIFNKKSFNKGFELVKKDE